MIYRYLIIVCSFVTYTENLLSFNLFYAKENFLLIRKKDSFIIEQMKPSHISRGNNMKKKQNPLLSSYPI
jgi:hypothetical protein